MTTLQRGFNTATSWLADMGRSALFLLRILMSLPSLVLKPRLLIEQIYSVGVLSLVIVVVAGMEGALPSVVTGLVDRPVIGVPTSVGYGAALSGLLRRK